MPTRPVLVSPILFTETRFCCHQIKSLSLSFGAIKLCHQDSFWCHQTMSQRPVFGVTKPCHQTKSPKYVTNLSHQPSRQTMPSNPITKPRHQDSFWCRKIKSLRLFLVYLPRLVLVSPKSSHQDSLWCHQTKSPSHVSVPPNQVTEMRFGVTDPCH